ncbi:MAG TPA: polysaccharide pyruvyl transferase family protein [Haliangiales bacterium]|nr:polysaccharide pyruvyl transferase family protein [Haliangiales bacterium]
MPARIAFISPTGYGNLGDAAIIDSLIDGIRRRIPDAGIVGFTMNPSDTRERHGIPAFTCTGVSLRDYEVREAPADPGRAGAPAPARRALAAIPGARRAYRFARLAVAEIRHRRLSAERIRGFDWVVVAGGGQLDDFWGGAFGHPYALLRWGQLARRAGARYVILSVGTGSLTAPLSARFVRRALALADYRSFRDGRSRELVGDPGLVRDDPIVPDLAYGLPLGPTPAAAPAATARPTVGVSPMAFADPRFWPEKDRERHRRHVESLAALAARLAGAGHEVVLFATDGSDRRSLAELRARADARLDAGGRARIRAPDYDGVAGLMDVLAGVDIVVAARLHGVLLGHVAGRPALAVSHERKVRTLMEDMGHARWCIDIDDFDPDAGFARLQEIAADLPALAAVVRRTAADYRRRVDAQYDRVFGPSLP